MATFVVCTRCGKVEEIAGIDLLPNTWQRTLSALLCSRCAMIAKHGVKHPPEEDQFYPESIDDFDEDFVDEDCSLCGGPCQGH